MQRDGRTASVVGGKMLGKGTRGFSVVESAPPRATSPLPPNSVCLLDVEGLQPVCALQVSLSF